MSAPAIVSLEVVILGTSWTPIYELQDSDGVAISLTDKVVIMRIRQQGGTTVTTRSTATAGQTAAPGGTGRLQFLFTAAEILAIGEGMFDLEFVYQDATTTPATKLLYGGGPLWFRAPATGTI